MVLWCYTVLDVICFIMWKVKLIAWSWATSQKAQIQCVGFPNITKMRCLSCLMLIQKLIGYVYAIILDACPLLSWRWIRSVLSILNMLVKWRKYVVFEDRSVWCIVNVNSEIWHSADWRVETRWESIFWRLWKGCLLVNLCGRVARKGIKWLRDECEELVSLFVIRKTSEKEVRRKRG